MTKCLRLSMIVFVALNLACVVSARKKDLTSNIKDTHSSPSLLAERRSANNSAVFAITTPKSGQQAGTSVLTVKGEGATQGDSIRVQVMTNEWYIQDGNSEIYTDGSWSYSPCHLLGKGNYRLHHSIKAELVRKGKVVATSTVDDVKAP